MPENTTAPMRSSGRFEMKSCMTLMLDCQRVTSSRGVLMSNAIIDHDRSITSMMSKPSVSRSISLLTVRGPAIATMRVATVARRRKRRREPAASRTGVDTARNRPTSG